MLKLGAIISQEEPTGIVHSIVTETGSCVHLEKIEDYIINRYVVQTDDIYRTIREIIEDEKQYLICKGDADVPCY